MMIVSSFLIFLFVSYSMKFFYKDMELDVPDNVYYPREDSELLAEALENIALKNRNALEVGCGSGLLSIIMAKSGALVSAVDINPAAVEATNQNAAKNNVVVKAFVSDMFENVRGTFDLIVFNPPYLPIGDDPNDIIYSGGSSGREIIELFVSQAKDYLKKNGNVLIIISSLTGEKEVIDLFSEVGMKADAIKRKKIPWEELIVIKAG